MPGWGERFPAGAGGRDPNSKLASTGSSILQACTTLGFNDRDAASEIFLDQEKSLASKRDWGKETAAAAPSPNLRPSSAMRASSAEEGSTKARKTWPTPGGSLAGSLGCGRGITTSLQKSDTFFFFF